MIPADVLLSGTARGLQAGTLPKMETLIRRTAEGIANALGATATLDWRVLFSALVNDPIHAAAMADTAAAMVGEDRIERNEKPAMVSEDFAYMLEKVPGAYIQLGIGDAAELHNPAYAFNDAAIPYGAAFFASLVERGLPG